MEEKLKKDSQSSSPQAQPQAQPGQNRILPAPTLNMSGVHGGVTSTNPLWWHSRLYNELGPLGSKKNYNICFYKMYLSMNFEVRFEANLLNDTFSILRPWTRCTIVQLPA